MPLSLDDIQSATWQRIRDTLVQPRIDTLRAQLETPGLDQAQTEGRRYAIKALRDLIVAVEGAPSNARVINNAPLLANIANGEKIGF